MERLNITESLGDDISNGEVKAAIKYNNHATFIADIALALLQENDSVLTVNGVREIIALYLLIPYVTDDTLTVPGYGCKIPELKGVFYKDDNMTINLKDLRQGLCHSFVTTEERKPGTHHGLTLVFDDRIKMDRKTHNSLSNTNQCVHISISYVRDKLIELFSKVQEKNNEHNERLKK